MVTRRAVLSGAAAAIAATTVGTTAGADQSIAVDPGTNYGTWEGWGTSLAWWANVFGDRDDFADLWFTTKSVTYNGTTLPGLGLNIARYNLGACSWNSVDGQRMAVSPNIPRFKQIETFWQDWRNTDPSSWQWGADAKQRASLVKAVARGATTELFSNSPAWWMCINRNPSGAADANNNNLQSQHYRTHAAYMAEVARQFRDRFGVTFRTVEPFNEPASNYWSATGKQEGCHFDRSTQRTVLQHLRQEMNTRGLTSMDIAASDETSYDAAHSTWTSFDATTKSVVDQINVHGYQGSGGRRDLVYADAKAAGKVLWNSETGERDGTGLTMATNLCLDWRWLHPTAWCYWQVMDPTPAWALIAYDPNTLRAGAVQNKLYVLAQFTRHIRPGMRIISASTGNAAVAYDPAARRLVLVAVNTATSAQAITFDLTRFTTLPTGMITRWSTSTTSGGDRYVQRTDVRLNGKLLRVPFAAGQVQTFQLDGVTAP
ncbi:glycoside hydrolase [Lentzea sp. BCCO 10_0798]|uniref:Glycoside hydrolase n=1 Tax=Lentzea kristufekii TaxID=3095430 RepID=A0ABU4U6H6_9PSEU|nr:glycoside hydrolase [Lentzea sp. BCCO 10_0798]MDX8056182.1 glycoside hydrolase [Lentzea sp. BCCO 10_0798]